MAKNSYNNVGAGVSPRLGQGKPRGLARPGKANNKPAGADGGGPKVARPGGTTKAPKAGGVAPNVARPGGAQGI